MVDLQRLRVRHGQAYAVAVRARRTVRRTLAVPRRVRVRVTMRQPEVSVTLGAAVGLGGLFRDAARALAVADRLGTNAALRFTGQLYRPSGVTGDWLESYFDRVGLAPTADMPSVDGAYMPAGHKSLQSQGLALWNYMRIRQEIWDSTNLYSSDPFVSVHFRGSDKYLEARRANETRVLDEAEKQLRASGLSRLFVASDERQFMKAAESRFGSAVFSLPQIIFAEDGRPPHFAPGDGEIKAREALQTMCLLSRASVRIRTDSLLSDWAETLADEGTSVNVNRIERLTLER